VRLLVQGAGLEATRSGHRLREAALGLALRGHELHWLGTPPAHAPPELQAWRGAFALRGQRAELALGAGATPRAAAVAGRIAGADCMVLATDAAEIARWSLLQRWAWHWLDGYALIEADQLEAFRAGGHGMALERVTPWSDAAPSAAPDAAHPDTEILERACERAVARSRAPALRAAVFVDRDGTLVRELGYLADPDQLELLPGAAEALARLRAAGYPVVLVSNQSGVGRGLFPLARVHQVMARLRRLLRARGVELDAIHFCPHRPEDGCSCRKPNPGLIERAAADLRLWPRRSVVIGDKLLDSAAARTAGARGILVRTGYGREEEARLRARSSGASEPAPDLVCDDLPAAADWILANLPGP
jgi:D-glycero-D-manno-heptose 1,7-bisphosphate phosphatase